MTTVEDILEHHGVKGMKWGVRRADKRWNKQIADVNTKSKMTLAFHNETVSRINRAVDDINRSDKYRNVDLSTYHGKLKENYEKDAHEAIMRAFEDSVRSHYGYNPSGTKQAVYNRKTDQIDIREVQTAQHADIPVEHAPDITFQLHRNQRGLIDHVSIIPLMQAEEWLNNFLEHHGIKGMKWGVRKDRSGSNSPVDVNIHLNRMQQISKVQGGSGHPASEDAIRTTVSRQKAHASGTHSLSTKELQDLVNRMNLEQQYSRLSSDRNKKTINRGQAHVKTILGVAKTAQEIHSVVNGPLGKALKAALKA